MIAEITRFRVQDNAEKTKGGSSKKVYTFEAAIQKVPDIDGAYVEIPFDVRKEFGKGHVPFHATFDGQPYDGSVVTFSSLCNNHFLV
ncbi:hypothetical protein SPSYN_02195 [Sporotomaculum syntrophicum]|uniref:Uncharacterized protein n=1 Tax=Sporotomaculum syntrophicum TaxID=182264 RepID=A0A9D3AY54_9FIRM|nr:hypothetical protein SPSYN_02195 [Sporotomaculum syntrophicum]